jgi:tetratricopeptide (TPR) repeat protein
MGNTGNNHLAQALEHLRKAAELEGESPAYFLALAEAELYAGNYQQAEIACEKNLLTNHSTNYKALLLLGEVQLRLKKPSEAWRTGQRALQIEQYQEEGWLLLARAASSSGEYVKAIRSLELYLKTHNDRVISPLMYIQLARLQLETGKPQDALVQLEQANARLKAMNRTPGSAFMSLRARILNNLEQKNEAIEYLQGALQLAPQDASLHGELGRAYLAQGKLEEAIKEFRQGTTLEPVNPVYYHLAGKASLEWASVPNQFSRRVEQYQQQAIELLSRATQLDGNNYTYWYDLAIAYQAVRNFEMVKETLKRAINHLPDKPGFLPKKVEYLKQYSQICQKTGDFRNALRAMEQILTLLPENAENLNDMGELYYKMGEWGEAYNYFRRAETISPDHPRFLANMSRVLLKIERVEEAQELIEEAAQLQQDDYYIRHQLGAARLSAGRVQEAIEDLREAASQEPDNPEFRYFLGKAYLQAGRLDEAIKEYEEAVTYDPRNAVWNAELGELYLKAREYGRALESWRMATQLERSNPDYRFNLAIALAANGEVRGAILTLKEEIRTLGNLAGAEWHYLLGYFLLEISKVDEALEYFNKANELEPENPMYKVDLAKTLRMKGEPIEHVLGLLKEAIDADPYSLQSFEELAYAYEASNNVEEALRTLESRLKEVLDSLDDF